MDPLSALLTTMSIVFLNDLITVSFDFCDIVTSPGINNIVMARASFLSQFKSVVCPMFLSLVSVFVLGAASSSACWPASSSSSVSLASASSP